VNASGGVTKSSRAVPSSVLAGGQRAMQEGQIGPRVDPKPLGNSYLMRHALRGTQRPSEVIRGHQRSSDAIRGHQRSSCAQGHQVHTLALRLNQTHSDEIRRNQTQSDAIRRNQTHSSPMIGRPSAVSGGSCGVPPIRRSSCLIWVAVSEAEECSGGRANPKCVQSDGEVGQTQRPQSQQPLRYASHSWHVSSGKAGRLDETASWSP
jgi:hypothetical protein